MLQYIIGELFWSRISTWPAFPTAQNMWSETVLLLLPPPLKKGTFLTGTSWWHRLSPPPSFPLPNCGTRNMSDAPHQILAALRARIGLRQSFILYTIYEKIISHFSCWPILSLWLESRSRMCPPKKAQNNEIIVKKKHFTLASIYR